MPTHEHHEEMRKSLLARQEALNDAAPATFDIANDIETAYRVAFIAATLYKQGDLLTRRVREARELLNESGYMDIRVRQLARLREEAEVTIDVMRYNADVKEEHGLEGYLADVMAKLKVPPAGSAH